MTRHGHAERRQLTERLKAARDRMVQLSPAHNVTPGTMRFNTPDELALYSAAKADYDAIVVEAGALHQARAEAGE